MPLASLGFRACLAVLVLGARDHAHDHDEEKHVGNHSEERRRADIVDEIFFTGDEHALGALQRGVEGTEEEHQGA